MAWKQLNDASMTVGYTGGWCLKYVQDAFGTDHPYATALDAWNANFGGGNHADELPPLGITVPVYFSLGNVPAGHVAIRLDDGWVASSTQPGDHPTPYYHRTLDDLIAVYGQYNGGCTYLGWSEFVGTVHVVEDAPDPIQAIADAQPIPNPVVAPIHNPDPTPVPVVEAPVPEPTPAPVETPAPIVETPAPVEPTPVVEPIMTPLPVPETPVTAPVEVPAKKVTFLSWLWSFIKSLLFIN